MFFEYLPQSPALRDANISVPASLTDDECLKPTIVAQRVIDSMVYRDRIEFERKIGKAALADVYEADRACIHMVVAEALPSLKRNFSSYEVVDRIIPRIVVPRPIDDINEQSAVNDTHSLDVIDDQMEVHSDDTNGQVDVPRPLDHINEQIEDHRDNNGTNGQVAVPNTIGDIYTQMVAHQNDINQKIDRIAANFDRFAANFDRIDERLTSFEEQLADHNANINAQFKNSNIGLQNSHVERDDDTIMPMLQVPIRDVPEDLPANFPNNKRALYSLKDRGIMPILIYYQLYEAGTVEDKRQRLAQFLCLPPRR